MGHEVGDYVRVTQGRYAYRTGQVVNTEPFEAVVSLWAVNHKSPSVTVPIKYEHLRKEPLE